MPRSDLAAKPSQEAAALLNPPERAIVKGEETSAASFVVMSSSRGETLGVTAPH